MASWWTDIADVILGGAQTAAGNPSGAGQTAAGVGGVAQSAATTSGFFGTVASFLTAMTDWHLWASLGWLALGVGLVIAGLWLWLKRAGVVPDAVPVPVPV